MSKKLIKNIQLVLINVIRDTGNIFRAGVNKIKNASDNIKNTD